LEKIPYLADLGVDGIWITPFFQSPLVDEGYDISNHYEINPQYGNMDIFDKIILECKKNNIEVLLDLVPNHVSDKHEWFIKSKKKLIENERNY
jgi:glycosidase